MRTQPLRYSLISLIWLCMLIANPASSQPPTRHLPLAKGVFLVATKDLDSSSFRQTVILLTGYSTQGASGLAINRSTDLTIHQAFPDIPRFSGDEAMMNLGGPVHTDAVFVIIKTQKPDSEMLQIAKDIYMASTLQAMQRSAERKQSGEQARAYAGYAGWAPGQLDAEVNQGNWLVIPADPAVIFSEPREQIWPLLFKTWSGQWT